MIRFTTVTKQFSPDSYGVKDVSFEIEPGELVFITGSSGSGKTTLMRLLTKEYDPTSGEIVFDEINLNQFRSSRVHNLRRKIGVVFQDYRLLPELNVWENIALPLSIIGKSQSEIEERVTDLLRLVSLTDKAFLFPSQLSGGEAQRISIARALATGPTVVFADEPTGNLDRETARSIANLLYQINKLGTTLLFATHSQDIVDNFKEHRRIHLEKGELKLDTKAKKSTTTKKEAAKTKVSEPGLDEAENEEMAANQDQNEKTHSASDSNKKASLPGKKGFLSWLFGKKKSEDIEEKEEEKSIKESKAKTDESKKDEVSKTKAKANKEDEVDSDSPRADRKQKVSVEALD
jgi:cell division transport system ATP-binding protein